MARRQPSNPPQFIRQIIFGMTQTDFAGEIGASQPSVSNWEAAGRFPAEHQDIIRVKGKEICSERGFEWSDSWFFELPPDLAAFTMEASDAA